MRALVVVVLLATACGTKPNTAQVAQTQAAVDRYVNADMQRNWAVLWTGKRPYKKLTPDAIDAGNADWVVTAMREHVVPRMTELIDSASKITVPQPMVRAHAMLLDIAREYRDEGKDMLDAATAKDSAKFKAAHARMLETTAREARWQAAFDQVLTDTGVVFAEVPQLAEPLPPDP